MELNYRFRDPALTELALTHRSIGKPNNERLEFLGDALLGAIVAEMLYEAHPKASEGELSRLRAQLVNGQALAVVARELDLGNGLKLGPGELKSGGFHDGFRSVEREVLKNNPITSNASASSRDVGADELQRRSKLRRR